MNATPKSLAAHFLCGALAVLVFHQGAVLILHLAGTIPNGPYQTRAVGPLGVPAFLNAAFWGGVWGIVYGLVRARIPTILPVLVAGFLFGIVGPTFFGWFVLAPLRGQPLGNGFPFPGIFRGIFVNGMYGVGVALFTQLTGRVIPSMRRP